MTSHQELASLLSRCAMGNRQAFERLYRATSGPLFGIVLKIVKDRDLASEVLQEGYVKIWTHAGKYRSNRATPMTWMGAIVRHQAIDLIRRSVPQFANRESVEVVNSLVDEGTGPLELTIRIEQEQHLHTYLEQLSGTQRRALILAYFQGLTHEEVAHHLNEPLGTVKSWIRRGLQRLGKMADRPWSDRDLRDAKTGT